MGASTEVLAGRPSGYNGLGYAVKGGGKISDWATMMLRVTEATFGRQVLRADLPALVCFGARACPGRQALRPALERIAASYRGRLLVAAVTLDSAPLLAEQYAIGASPTLMAFHYGERMGRAVGFMPDGLIDLLAEEVAEGALRGDILWSPVEERFEDLVLIPLLRRWGLSFQRQAPCALPGAQKPSRGRIDLLVYERPDAPPLTLIESKRQILGSRDLAQAEAQAAGYARSLGLPSFIVAAPQGLWLYRVQAARNVCVQHLSSLELQQAPQRPPLLFPGL